MDDLKPIKELLDGIDKLTLDDIEREIRARATARDRLLEEQKLLVPHMDARWQALVGTTKGPASLARTMTVGTL